MWRPTVKCAACGAVMANTGYRAGRPWVCISCSRKYQIAGWFLRLPLRLHSFFDFPGGRFFWGSDVQMDGGACSKFAGDFERATNEVSALAHAGKPIVAGGG